MSKVTIDTTQIATGAIGIDNVYHQRGSLTLTCEGDYFKLISDRAADREVMPKTIYSDIVVDGTASASAAAAKTSLLKCFMTP